MDPEDARGAAQANGASKAPSIFKPSSISSSGSSWVLSGRLGLRELMHRDMITCRFIRSLSRSWLKKYCGQPRQNSAKSSSPLRWSSSPFFLSSPELSSSSIPSHFLRSPVSRLSFPALKDRDRDKDQASTTTSYALNGHRSSPSTPGMTVGLWGPSTQQTATHNTSSTASPACSLGQKLRHHSSSG